MGQIRAYRSRARIICASILVSRGADAMMQDNGMDFVFGLATPPGSRG
jgi:hypothetical protein